MALESGRSLGEERDLFAYEMIALRNLDQDQMLWQTPTLALTAQAFLLTIALGADSSVLARYASASLGVVVAVISMQLMAKHRWCTELDHFEMRRLEEKLGLPAISSRAWAFGEANPTKWYRRRPQHAYVLSNPRTSLYRRRRSYVVWQVGIGLFGLANLGLVAVTFFRASWLR
jgi:hypothetical protein